MQGERASATTFLPPHTALPPVAAASTAAIDAVGFSGRMQIDCFNTSTDRASSTTNACNSVVARHLAPSRHLMSLP